MSRIAHLNHQMVFNVNRNKRQTLLKQQRLSREKQEPAPEKSEETTTTTTTAEKTNATKREPEEKNEKQLGNIKKRKEKTNFEKEETTQRMFASGKPLQLYSPETILKSPKKSPILERYKKAQQQQQEEKQQQEKQSGMNGITETHSSAKKKPLHIDVGQKNFMYDRQKERRIKRLQYHQRKTKQTSPTSSPKTPSPKSKRMSVDEVFRHPIAAIRQSIGGGSPKRVPATSEFHFMQNLDDDPHSPLKVAPRSHIHGYTPEETPMQKEDFPDFPTTNGSSTDHSKEDQHDHVEQIEPTPKQRTKRSVPKRKKRKTKKSNGYDAAKDVTTTSPPNQIKEMSRTNSGKSNQSLNSTTDSSNASTPKMDPLTTTPKNSKPTKKVDKDEPKVRDHEIMVKEDIDDEEEEEQLDLHRDWQMEKPLLMEDQNEPSTTCPPAIELPREDSFIARAVRRHRSNSFKQSPLTFTPLPPLDNHLVGDQQPKNSTQLTIEQPEEPSPRSRTRSRSIINASSASKVDEVVEKKNDSESSSDSDESVHKSLRNFMQVNRMGEKVIQYNDLHRTSYLRQIPTSIDGVEGLELGEGNVAARRKLGMVSRQPYHQTYHSNAVNINIPTTVEDPAKYLHPDFVPEDDNLRPQEEKLDYIKTQVMSWNMNGYKMTKRETQALIRFVIPGTQHIYVFGTQECMRSVQKSMFVQPKPEWEDFLTALLGSEYVPLASSTLVGSHMIVFIRRSLLPFVSALHTHEVPCGIFNEVGNRGATSISFRVGKTKFAFINVHLTSKQKNTERRHRNLQKIIDQVQYYIDVDGHGKHIYLPSSSRTGVYAGIDYSTKHRLLIAEEEPEKGKTSRAGSILHLKKAAKNRLHFEPYDLSLKPSEVEEEELVVQPTFSSSTLNPPPMLKRASSSKLTTFQETESFQLGDEANTTSDEYIKKTRRRSSLFNMDSFKSLGSQLSFFGRNIGFQADTTDSSDSEDMYEDTLDDHQDGDVDRLLQQKDKSNETTLKLKNGSIFEDMDHVVFLGDFNYRINGNLEIIEKCIEENEIDIMLQNDQLNRSRIDKQLPGHRHLFEGRIFFNPTYCFVPHRNVYNNNAHKRVIPSWPSRILFSKHADTILLEYDSCYQFRYSQHRPVHARMLMHVDFDVKTDKFDSKHRVKPYTSSTSVCTIS